MLCPCTSDRSTNARTEPACSASARTKKSAPQRARFLFQLICYWRSVFVFFLALDPLFDDDMLTVVAFMLHRQPARHFLMLGYIHFRDIG